MVCVRGRLPGFAFATQAWHVWALFMVYSVFYSLSEPPEKTLVASLMPGERKGLAYGWYNFALGISALPASVLFGVLWDRVGAVAAFGTGQRSRSLPRHCSCA